MPSASTVFASPPSGSRRSRRTTPGGAASTSRRGSAGRRSGRRRVTASTRRRSRALTISSFFRISPTASNGLDDRGIGERDLVRDPLVVHLGDRSGEARSLRSSPCPAIRTRPRIRTRRTTAATGVGGDRLGEFEQLVPASWGSRSRSPRTRRRVPDVALDVRHERRGVDGAVDRAVVLPGGGPVLVDVGRDRVGRRSASRRRRAAEQTGLRHDRDVGGGAALGEHRDLRLEPLDPWYSTSMPVTRRSRPTTSTGGQPRGR